MTVQTTSALRQEGPQQDELIRLVLKQLLVQLKWAVSHDPHPDKFTENIATFTSEAERGLAALSASRTAQEGQQEKALWLPIDTAPRDGSEIELWGVDGIDIGNWQDAQPDSLESGVIVDPGMDAGFYGCKGYWPGGNQATHWRIPVGPSDAALPSSPAEGEKEDK